MTIALLDMSEQVWHLIDVMLAILQPALWLLLCGGFVLASAHLLTMLGTRWGDRRVTTKAFLFSVGIHLSLGVAIVAMIPEYRQHLLSLGQDDPPITIEMRSSFDDARAGPQATAGQAVWDRLPEVVQHTPDRSLTEEAEPAPEQAPPRPAAMQLADARAADAMRLPDAPEETPAPAPRAELTPSAAPAMASLSVNAAPAEARAEVAPPRVTPQRSAVPQPSTPPTAESPGRPPALQSIDQPLSPRRREQSLDAPTTASLSEIPSLAEAAAPAMSALERPAPLPLPTITPAAGAPSVASAAVPDAAAPGATRTRSDIALSSASAAPSDERPGMRTPEFDQPNRSAAVPATPRAADPALPDLFRPDSAPTRPEAAEALARIPATFSLRTDQERKDEAIRRFGGTEDSQRAVERALHWLASVQEADGRWDASRFDAGNGLAETDPKIAERRYAGRKSDTGVTGLVLLAMLADGNSLDQGPYAANVDRAARWLIAQQAANGSLAGDATVFEAMYCHGIATLALAESFAMETDPAIKNELRGPLQKALGYSVAAQLEDGGWRYLPKQLGGGDMSMFGWQLMAFRSAQDAGLAMPEKTRTAMLAFLKERGRGPSGSLAGYRGSDQPSAAMSAEALYCKQMLGLKRDNPMTVEAVRYLLQHMPRLGDLNLYYWYYGTLAMFHYGGPEWLKWNDSLRDLLISEQLSSGPNAGSWEPRDLHSRYGGRLYSTALATLCLEVYYRRLPMYQWAAPEAPAAGSNPR